MATYTMNINPLSYALIVDGSKTMEVRLKRDGVENYKEGDTLSITNRETGETVEKKIERVVSYASLDDLLQNEDLACTGAFQDKEAFVHRMRSFQTEAEERQFGLTAIHLA